MSWCSKQDSQSHTSCAHPHTHFLADKILTALVQWCVTARVQPLARWHGCCDRSQGEHLPHQTRSLEQQSGGRRRHSSRKIPGGNGFDVQEVCVPGHVLLVSTDVVLHSGVSSERRQVIVQFVCAASVFSLLSRREAFTRVKVGVARFQNRLDQKSLSPSALARLQCAITARLQDCGGPFELRP